MGKKRIKRLKRLANRLSGAYAHIAFSKNPSRKGKHRWRDGLDSRGAASPVRILVKDGVPVE